ncbi:ABC transporter permease [Acutalibacter caecimuris]|uniref:ABC transporter permease n=1 Tax=Acutalibacter caecimuris TaxID=3093657 RepID=UPI002AC92F0E|nr:ABC transporter permease [Acutalibacter sp. M00118]
MRLWAFSRRTAVEILRDPLNLAFGLGFPLVLLLLMTLLQANIPVRLFELERLAPGMAVFGLSFMTLFSATLIAKDRESALLQRLYTSPLTGADYILGYALPVFPIALGQCVACYLAAWGLGLPVTWYTLCSILLILPVSIPYIGLGLLCGSVLSVKQVGGICGALLTNVAAWFSGIWFDLDLVGGPFKRIAYILPFVHGVEVEKAALVGDFAGIWPHLWWVLRYGVVIFTGAIWVFTAQMRRD